MAAVGAEPGHRRIVPFQVFPQRMIGRDRDEAGPQQYVANLCDRGVGQEPLDVLLLPRRHLRRRGVVFLSVVVQGAVSLVVWLLADYLRQYLDPGMQAMTVVLAIGMFGAVTLLLTEAHEWTEALWLRRWQRQPELPRPQQANAPKVSVHVPACPSSWWRYVPLPPRYSPAPPESVRIP